MPGLKLNHVSKRGPWTILPLMPKPIFLALCMTIYIMNYCSFDTIRVTDNYAEYTSVNELVQNGRWLSDLIPHPSSVIRALVWTWHGTPRTWCVNSSRPGDAYMRQINQVIIVSGNGLASVWRQAITWNNVDFLSMGVTEDNLEKFKSNTNVFILRKCIWKCRLQNVGHSVLASMCYVLL